MKVAFDSKPTKTGHAVRGVGFYTKNLMHYLGNNVIEVDVNKVNLADYDLIHIPHYNPFLNTFPKGIEKHKYVVTIHDLIPLLYPKNYPPGLRGKIKFRHQKKLAQQADAIITDSETSKKDIVRLLGIQSSKIFPIKLAPEKRFKKITDHKFLDKVREKFDLPDKYVLYVGDINYNKNIPTLIKACSIANMPLVICGKQASELENLGQDLMLLQGPNDWIRYIFGKPHPELAHYKEVLKLVDANKSVFRLGFVPDDEIVAIYNLASVYCQPSLYEGFGLPVVEAFASCVPVVCSKTQALVELGQDACLYADPNSPNEFAEKIKLAQDKQVASSLTKKGEQIVKSLSWEKTAQETLQVYKQVLEK